MEAPTTKPKYYWLSLSAVVVGILVNAAFGYLNWQERAEMRREQNMTRTMLNARAQIQITLFEAAKRGGQLTPAEVQTIDRLWIPAEYDIDKRPTR